MNSTIALVVSALLLARSAGLVAQTAGTEAVDAVVLVTTYADGRIVRHVVTREESLSWTPLFPRMTTWVPAPGAVPVYAINYRKQLVENQVRVAVSVLLGVPHQKEEPVATVSLGPGERRIVDQLTDFGVQPVTLSLSSLAATSLYAPTVLNRTAGLDVSEIEVITDPAPKYRVHVRNLSSKGALTFYFRTHHHGRVSLSGQQGHRDGRVLIPPGETHVFDVSGSSAASPTSDGWTPASHDHFEIASVLWDDRTFEGDAEPVASALMLAVGRHMQLSRVTRLVRATIKAPQPPAAAVARLTAQIESLTVVLDDEIRAAGFARLRDVVDNPDEHFAAAPPGMREVKAGVLSDLRDAPSTPVAFQHWLHEITAQYERRRDRFAQR